MHICREVNLASSSSWMYIAYNPYWLICFTPSLVLCFGQKGGEKFIWFCFYFNPFVDDWQKGGERFWVYMHNCVQFYHAYQINIHLHTYLCASLPYLIIYVYAWVKGELLWSFTLIHTYITSWVLSSSKRGDCWPKAHHSSFDDDQLM